jgi:hypothetical protein
MALKILLSHLREYSRKLAFFSVMLVLWRFYRPFLDGGRYNDIYKFCLSHGLISGSRGAIVPGLSHLVIKYVYDSEALSDELPGRDSQLCCQRIDVLTTHDYQLIEQVMSILIELFA